MGRDALTITSPPQSSRVADPEAGARVPTYEADRKVIAAILRGAAAVAALQARANGIARREAGS